MFAVAVMTPFFFVGFDVVPQTAGEADVSMRFLGMVISVSVAFAALFYIAVIWAAGSSVPTATLADSTLPAAKAMAIVYGSDVAGTVMALAGLAGILTSWNGFILGASRAIYALAESHMLPDQLARVHSKYNTPSNAVLLVGFVAGLAPLFGEQMLVWVVNAGGFGLVIAWVMVVISFFVLRRREPEMDRPFRLPAGRFIGGVALLLSLFFVTLYLPGSPLALAWPYEWGIIVGWILLGVGLIAINGGLPAQSEAEVHMLEQSD
ncbi:APC family permease [Halomicrococcus sp. NG-SE-24]|uniref:APC family permease n=1 Tax=Halomicrococcus sp. NG-SE-24 TaxID=3436928 RepID=UPI003D95F4D8